MGDQALYCYYILYHKVCNIVDAVKAALLSNSACIVIAHNHPSGGLEPSLDDIETTRQLVAAGKILGVEVLDHLIVTYRSVVSIREIHPDLF